MEIPKEISTSGGRVAKGTKPEQILQNLQAIENIIRIYTTYTLNSFRNLAIANVIAVFTWVRGSRIIIHLHEKMSYSSNNE